MQQSSQMCVASSAVQQSQQQLFQHQSLQQNCASNAMMQQFVYSGEMESAMRAPQSSKSQKWYPSPFSPPRITGDVFTFRDALGSVQSPRETGVSQFKMVNNNNNNYMIDAQEQQQNQLNEMSGIMHRNTGCNEYQCGANQDNSSFNSVDSIMNSPLFQFNEHDAIDQHYINEEVEEEQNCSLASSKLNEPKLICPVGSLAIYCEPFDENTAGYEFPKEQQQQKASMRVTSNTTKEDNIFHYQTKENVQVLGNQDGIKKRQLQNINNLEIGNALQGIAITSAGIMSPKSLTELRLSFKNKNNLKNTSNTNIRSSIPSNNVQKSSLQLALTPGMTSDYSKQVPMIQSQRALSKENIGGNYTRMSFENQSKLKIPNSNLKSSQNLTKKSGNQPTQIINQKNGNYSSLNSNSSMVKSNYNSSSSASGKSKYLAKDTTRLRKSLERVPSSAEVLTFRTVASTSTERSMSGVRKSVQLTQIPGDLRNTKDAIPQPQVSPMSLSAIASCKFYKTSVRPNTQLSDQGMFGAENRSRNASLTNGNAKTPRGSFVSTLSYVQSHQYLRTSMRI